MPRRQQVTRTLKITNILALCVNLETGAASDRTFKVARHIKDQRALLGAAIKLNQDSSVRPVFIKAVTYETVLYGMDECDFIQHAEEIKKVETC